MPTKPTKLLFVDTNIWLNFYRARNESLNTLKRIETVSDRLIVTYQLESEFKKNRQSVIHEGMKGLKAPENNIPRLGIFSDAEEITNLDKNFKEIKKLIKDLRSKLTFLLKDPCGHDPVYQACERIFCKADSLVLTRNDPIRHQVRRRAFRRFLHGCPPRKKNDTSFGDAFNWEWMIHCATAKSADLVIVSQDADYGILLEDGTAYVNDHLRQEFNEQVGQGRQVLLYTKLTQALKQSFNIPVSKKEKDAENELVKIAKAEKNQGLGIPLSSGNLLRSNSFPSLIQSIPLNSPFTLMNDD